VDRTETSRGTARWLRTLGAVGPINVVAAHVARAGEDLALLEQSLARDLEDDVADLRASGRVTFEARAAEDMNVDETLVDVAKTKMADLIVVGSHQRSAMGRVWRRSVSRGVLHLAPVSVVVVSSSAARDEERSTPVIRDVLVATDLSPLGDAAIPHALSLLPDGGTLHLAHVVSPALGMTPITALAPMRPPVRDEGALAEVRAELERLVPRDADARGVDVHVHVLEGEVADALCEAADGLAVDALCMASRGRSRAAAAVLGSSTQNVLAKSTRPVFVVRTPQA
jgi:nucleotide-binding universal stress UspA family protein